LDRLSFRPIDAVEAALRLTGTPVIDREWLPQYIEEYVANLNPSYSAARTFGPSAG
jgi:hypothetical protein